MVFSIFKQFINYIRWLYMQYLLNTALYMLEPGEIKLFNTFLFLFIVTTSYSAYVFLPDQMLGLFYWFTQGGSQASLAHA
jgi:hypothetical protein